jgi:hypothetical protein
MALALRRCTAQGRLRRPKSAVLPILSNGAQFRTHLCQTQKSRHEGGSFASGGAGAIKQTAQIFDPECFSKSDSRQLPPKLPATRCDAASYCGWNLGSLGIPIT